MSYGDDLGITLPTDGTADWGEGKLNPILQALIDVLQTKVAAGDIDIRSALVFNGQDADDVGGVNFRNGSSKGATKRFYVSNGELHFVDGSSNDIQLTLNGTLNYSGSGSITGLAGTGASAAYDGTTKVFTWLDQTGAGAGMEFGILRLRKVGTTNVTRISASDDLSTSYGIMLPSSSLAAGVGLFTINSSGRCAITKDPTVNTINVSGQTILAGGGSTSGTIFVTGALELSGALSHGMKYRTIWPRVDTIVFGTLTSSLGGITSGGSIYTWTTELRGIEAGDRIRRIAVNWRGGATTAKLTASLISVDLTGSSNTLVTGTEARSGEGACVVVPLNTSGYYTGSAGFTHHIQLRVTDGAGTTDTTVRSVVLHWDRPRGSGN